MGSGAGTGVTAFRFVSESSGLGLIIEVGTGGFSIAVQPVSPILV